MGFSATVVTNVLQGTKVSDAAQKREMIRRQADVFPSGSCGGCARPRPGPSLSKSYLLPFSRCRWYSLLKALEVSSSHTLPAFAELEFLSPPRENPTTHTAFYRALVGQIGSREVGTAG